MQKSKPSPIQRINCSRRQVLIAASSAVLIASTLPLTGIAASSDLSRKMQHYVLVHGAWHGGWAWKEVASRLRKRGHSVSTPTLAGLGDRSHLHNQQIGLGTHIQDIVSHLEMEDLRDVVLVGHSYAGMVVAGVLGENTGRVKSAVFLDAFLPEKGKGLADYIPPKAKLQHEQLYRDGKLADPPPEKSWGERWGLYDSGLRAWVAERIRPQAPLTFLEPLRTDPIIPGVEYTYIRCEKNKNNSFAAVAERVKKDSRWQFIGLDSYHNVMLLEPELLTKVLLDI